MYNVYIMASGGGSSEFLRGTGTTNLGLKGVTPLKTHRFWPIYFLPMNNFAIFLDFSFLFFSFLYYFLPSQNCRGDIPPLKILGGTPPSTACVYGLIRFDYHSVWSTSQQWGIGSGGRFHYYSKFHYLDWGKYRANFYSKCRYLASNPSLSLF